MPSTYVSISLELSQPDVRIFDLRVPRNMSVNELLHILTDSYQLSSALDLPYVRIDSTQQILFGTDTFKTIKNGSLLKIESNKRGI